MSRIDSVHQTAFRFPTRGGRRTGAGRPKGVRPRIRHRSREGVTAAHPALVTLKVRPGIPPLRSRRFVHEFERSLAALRARTDFRVVHFSIQTNHAHFVVEADDAGRLGRGMKALGARFSRAVNRVLGTRGPALRDRYHLRVLRTPREVGNAIAYVLLNVRKHRAQRELETPPGIDPASSGRWFDGWKGAAYLSREPAVVSRARTWLLRLGWRRRGLITLSEIPGGREIESHPDRARAATTRHRAPAELKSVDAMPEIFGVADSSERRSGAQRR